MSADKLTRAERRRQEKDLLRNVTRPDTAKGARKRRKISAAMEAAAEEAALKLRAEEVAEMTPRYRTESDAIMLADRAGPWVKIDDLLEACRRRVAAAAFLSHPVDTGQGVGEEEVKRMAGALANDAILGSVCSDGNSNVQDVALRLAAVAAQALAARPPLDRAAMVDRLERAAMAYERLGKVTRDDEKSRQIRKDALAELAAARKALL